MGSLSQRIGEDFEASMSLTFDAYERHGVASIDFMPIPMYPTGMTNPKTGAPLYSPKGKPPFDAYGYWWNDAAMIGAEFKATSQPSTSLAIIGPDCDGAGLEWHQLDALAKLASKNGIARLVWNNGGQIGVLYGSKIIAAHRIFSDAMKTEKNPTMKAPKGAKSIRWEEFRVIQPSIVGRMPIYDWLMLDSIV